MSTNDSQASFLTGATVRFWLLWTAAHAALAVALTLEMISTRDARWPLVLWLFWPLAFGLQAALLARRMSGGLGWPVWIAAFALLCVSWTSISFMVGFLFALGHSAQPLVFLPLSMAMGAATWLTLRRRMRRVGLFAVSQVVGALLFGVVYGAIDRGMDTVRLVAVSLSLSLASGAIFGAVTGAASVALRTPPPQPRVA